MSAKRLINLKNSNCFTKNYIFKAYELLLKCTHKFDLLYHDNELIILPNKEKRTKKGSIVFFIYEASSNRLYR